MLLGKKAEGVDLKLFTTDDYTPTHREGLRGLIGSRKEVIRPENRRFKIVGIVLIILGIPIAIFTAGVGLIISIIGAFIYRRGAEKSIIRWFSEIGDENLLVYHTDPFRPIHAKVYVADDQVALGSPNLTKGGTAENLESLVWLKSPKLADQMVKELGSLEKDLRLQRIPIDEVGRAVYRAPRPRRRAGL